MNLALDCIPCFLCQALEATRLVSADARVHEQIFREMLHVASDLELAQTPPSLAQTLHRRLKHRRRGANRPARLAGPRGAPEIAEVIDNGSDAPGTILADCSDSFRRRFEAAEIVIAKGQGNFESLCGTNKRIAFWFKVKCPLVSRQVGLPLGSHALLPPRAVTAPGAAVGV